MVGYSNDLIAISERTHNVEVLAPASGTALFADLWVVPAGAVVSRVGGRCRRGSWGARQGGKPIPYTIPSPPSPYTAAASPPPSHTISPSCREATCSRESLHCFLHGWSSAWYLGEPAPWRVSRQVWGGDREGGVVSRK